MVTRWTLIWFRRILFAEFKSLVFSTVIFIIFFTPSDLLLVIKSFYCVAETIFLMAASRSRRDNAGTKMSGLLDKEEEDEFYKTTYGGFDDVGDDTEFNYNSPAEEEDEVDSDFSIDENDEVKSDPEEDESARKKAKVNFVFF